MRLNTPASPLLAPAQRATLCDGSHAWSLTFTRVPRGVVTGRRHRHGATAHTDRWALFQTRDQFAQCAARDPLRFADPLMFVRMKTEFDHAYEQAPSTQPGL